MQKPRELKVKFIVTRIEERLGWRRYFTSNGAQDNQVCLYNFPPFYELEGSKISVTTSKASESRPRSCLIVAREVPQIPRDPLIKSYFNERIPGVPWVLASLEASCFDEGDSFYIKIPEKSGITSHDELKAFLLAKYYIITESSFSRPHKKFIEKMKKVGKKNFTEKDVRAHFDFPEILSYPW